MRKRLITTEDLLRLQDMDDPQVHPDGSRVVFTVRSVDAGHNAYHYSLWLVEIAGGRSWQLTPGDNDSAPRWSPDGRWLAFLRAEAGRTQIWSMPADGEARPLTDLEEGSLGAPCWSPDGTRLAFAFRPTHPDWTAEALERRRLLGLSLPPRVVTRLQYRFEGLGYLDLRQHVWVCDATSGAAQQLTAGDYDDYGPAWSPDGSLIAFTSNRCDDPELKPWLQDIWLAPAGGGNIRPVAGPPGYKSSVAWSPDGRRIAYIGAENQTDPWGPHNDHLWVIDVQGGGARCLSASLDRTARNTMVTDALGAGESAHRPIWSADGRTLFFLVSDRGATHAYAVDWDAPAPRPLIDGALDVLSFGIDAAGQVCAALISRPTQPAELFVGALPAERGGSLQLRPLTRRNAALLDELQLAEPEEFWCQSDDGTSIQSWLLKPPAFDPGRRYPLVLYIHGGPEAQCGYTFFHELQLLAARGFVVLYPNARGSFGREERFATALTGRWGSLDFQDAMAATDHAAALPFVDAARMAVTGGSYGGYMTNWVITHTDRFRCAVTDRCFSNLHSEYGTADWAALPDGCWPGNAWDRPEAVWEQSPLRYAAQVHTPLLILQCEGDMRCPIEQAEQFYAALKLLKREVVFVRYPPQTGHMMPRLGPPDLRVDRLQRIIAWMDSHLQAAKWSEHARKSENGSGAVPGRHAPDAGGDLL